MAENYNPEPKRVAVVAVHGVGKHESGESANAVADLLLGLNGFKEGGETPYHGFESEELKIPLPGPALFQPSSREDDSFIDKFQERRGYFRDLYKCKPWQAAVKPRDIATEFMSEQLDQFEGDKNKSTYATFRLNGHRTNPQGQAIDVDIYEMHWADLARPSNSFVRFLLAFFQLLLHLTTLGRHAVDHAAAEHTGQWDWFLFQRLYTYATRTLTLWIFNLLILLPVVAFAPLPLMLSDGAGQALLGIMVFAIVLGLVFSIKLPDSFLKVLPTLGIAAAATAIAAFLVHTFYLNYLPVLLELGWWLLALIVLLKIIFPWYDQVRSGAREFGRVMALVIAVGFFALAAYQYHAIRILRPSELWWWQLPPSFENAAFLGIQCIFLLLSFGWLTGTGLVLLSLTSEGICRIRLRLEKQREQLARARAAARTARFTLSVSFSLILLTTLFLWAGVYRFTVDHTVLFAEVDPTQANITTLWPFLKHFILSPQQTDVVLRSVQLQKSAPSQGTANTPPPALMSFSVEPKQSAENKNTYFVFHVNNDEKALGPPVYVEYSASPTFDSVSTIPLNDNPSKDDRRLGNEAFYFRACSAYDNSPPSEPVYFSSVSTRTPLVGGKTIEALPGDGVHVCESASKDSRAFLDGILLQGAPPGLSVAFGFMGAGFVMLLLMIVASVYHEISPPLSASNHVSRFFGSWLSSGFSTFRVAIWFFWIAAFGVPTVYLLTAYFRHGGTDLLMYLYTSWGMTFTYGILSKGGTLIAGSAALIFGVLIKSVSSALDVILDADNYLRTSPPNATPRARIVERYLALLRFVHTSEKKYDRIVIVAHSLGALISADLFRYLKQISDNSRERKQTELVNYVFSNQSDPTHRTWFFTMGNPLRQLLNRFFPHLYGWVRPIPDDTGEKLPGSAGSFVNATDLGVVQWWNSYRSGDYIGRSVWREGMFDDSHPLPATNSSDGPEKDSPLSRTNGSDDEGAFPKPLYATEIAISEDRVESCIGLGAHTHYWDRTAPDIAEQLDCLITGAGKHQIKKTKAAGA